MYGGSEASALVRGMREHKNALWWWDVTTLFSYVSYTTFILLVLEQQHRELSEPANAHTCFLFTHPYFPSTRRPSWAAGYTRPLVFISISLVGRTDTRTEVLVSIPSLCHPEPTDSLIHLLTPTTISARDVSDHVTRSSTTLQMVTRCGGDGNIDGGSAARQRGRFERLRRDKRHCWRVGSQEELRDS